jgi:hypothetical protein
VVASHSLVERLQCRGAEAVVFEHLAHDGRHDQVVQGSPGVVPTFE